MRGYWRQNAIAFDQQINTLLGGAADETLSSRAWRSRDHKYWGWTHKFIDKLFFWQPAHCYRAYIQELQRKQLPPDFLKG